MKYYKVFDCVWDIIPPKIHTNDPPLVGVTGILMPRVLNMTPLAGFVSYDPILTLQGNNLQKLPQLCSGLKFSISLGFEVSENIE